MWKNELTDFLTILITTAIISHPAQAEDWTVTSLDWQPFSGGNLKNDGAAFYALRELLKSDNVKVNVKYYPWLRSKKEATANPAIVGYYPSWPSEVVKGFFASEPIFSSPVGFAELKEKAVTWKTLDDLKPYSIASVADYVYPPEFQQMIDKKTLNVYQSRTDSIALKMLCAKRVNLVAIDKYVMQHLLQTDPDIKKSCGDRVQFNSKVLINYDLVVAFYDTPENRKRSVLLSDALKRTGGGQAFITQYFEQK